MRIHWSCSVRGTTALQMRDHAEILWDAFCGDVPYSESGRSRPYRSYVEIRAAEGIKVVSASGEDTVVEYEGTAVGWVEI